MNQAVRDILRSFNADAATFDSGGSGIYHGRVPGELASGAWAILSDAYGKTGLWPIIRGDPADAQVLEESAEAAASPSDIPDGSVTTLLGSQFSDRREMFKQLGLKIPAVDDAVAFARTADAANIHAFVGRNAAETPWPSTPREFPMPPQFEALALGRKRPLPEMLLTLVEVDQPYQAAAVLGFGGWNEAPEPLLQSAVLREWYKQYAAVPAVMNGDTLECVVGRPPQDEAASYALAAEQWMFCEDIVGQGTQSIRNLAIEIWKSPKWFFWWD